METCTWLWEVAAIKRPMPRENHRNKKFGAAVILDLKIHIMLLVRV
jgi:hypothetical protein